MSVSHWVKHAYAFPHFPTIHTLSTTQPTKYQPTHNTTTTLHTATTTLLHLTTLLFCRTCYTYTIIALKPLNIAIHNTLYINNIVIPQQQQNPLELKIKPCRAMLYFKAQNHLFKSPLHSIDIIINQYNQPASAERIKPLQGNKKSTIYKRI